MKEKREKAVAIYHRIMRRENFETAAKDIFHLLVETQKKEPDRPRSLYLNIDGHRNEAGGFDKDMMELQKEFLLGFLAPYFTELHLPLGTVINKKGQNNDIMDELEIFSAEDKKEDSLHELYMENYENTEFMSEKDVYAFLKKASKVLKKFGDMNIQAEDDYDPYGWMSGWGKYIQNLIVELFNSFIHGNLLSVSAMTRALIESYVYLRILKEERSEELLHDWCICSLMSGMKRMDEKGKKQISDIIENYCRKAGAEGEDYFLRFGKGNQNSWLTNVIQKKQVTFRDACEYLREPEIYQDFQSASAFVHGQDIISKIVPFTFYHSIYQKLYLMMLYSFKTMRLYAESERLEGEMIELEKELNGLAENYV